MMAVVMFYCSLWWL